QRHVGVLAPGRGIVDDGDPGGGEARRLHPRHGGAGGEQRDIESGRIGGLGVFHHDLAAPPRQLLTGRPGRGEEPHLIGREVALFEQLAHDGADLTGRADHSYPYTHVHRPVPAWTTATSSPPRSKARCSTLTASSSWDSATSTEMRISEVEIRSMLTPASASDSQNVAVTPGCDFIPAPTSETLPMFSSERTSEKPISALRSV